MNKRVFNFEHNGTLVLGFDTGLGAQAFAQAKMAAYITDPGFIVYPDGRVETWLPAGTAERDTMFIWGPSFSGVELAVTVNGPGRKDEALDAFRFWLRAAVVMEEKLPPGKEPPFPGPAGAFIVSGEARGGFPEGTVFFPPARLLRRTLEAGSPEDLAEAGRWIHPDLNGAESVSFSAGAVLYRIFSGASPFPDGSGDGLRQDIREAVFIPPQLAAPGLDPEICGIITRAMSRIPQNKEENQRPAPDVILGFTGPPSSRSVSSWVRVLNDEERLKIRAEQEQYTKKKNFAVNTRRFVTRNTAILAASLIGAAVLVFSVWGHIRHQAGLPTTKGMVPAVVAETFYGAFGALDHALMEACVAGKAGKGDIDMVVNLFVITRVRQAYETTGDNFMSAQEWIDAGRPLTDKAVFGITDLTLKVISESAEDTALEAEYILWMPGAYLQEDDAVPPPGVEETSPLPPAGISVKDKLSLAFEKDRWRITEILRENGPLKR